MSVQPYRSTEEFTEATLPEALRREHRTKPGVWAVIRVLEGTLRYTQIDPPTEQLLTPEQPGLVVPQARHFVTPLGPLRMRVEFYDAPPDAS